MAAYTLHWKYRAGSMPGACETCDFMGMEDDSECIVGYIGDVTARVLCMQCVHDAAKCLPELEYQEPQFSAATDRMAKARAAKAAKRALREVEYASAGSVS